MQKITDFNIVVSEGSKLQKKETRTGKSAKDFTLLYLRWVFLVISGVLLFTDPNPPKSSLVVLEAFAVVIITEIFVSWYSVRTIKIGKQLPEVFYFLDIVILSVFAYLNGGLESDIYILLFFLIGYCSLFNRNAVTARISFFSAIAYSAASLLVSFSDVSEFNFWRLSIRDLLLVMTGFGISRINAEIKKYDELHRRESLIARTDKLTGLANRHFFDQKLKEEIAYSDATGSPISILMFDIDNFKTFNDTYGHTWGDKLLVLFSDIIRQSIRKSDIPVRYGGEEFLVLIRDLDIVLAYSVADRIRLQLERQRIYVGDVAERKRVTVSCGIAQYPINSNNIKSVIELADKALYYAKSSGKNKVVKYNDIA